MYTDCLKVLCIAFFPVGVIPLNFNRPKLNQTLAETVTIDFEPPAVNGDDIEIRFFLDNIVIDPITITDLSIAPITWTTGGTSITGDVDSFINVRIGDIITSTSGTDFASGQIVTDVSSTFNSVTVDQPIDGDTDSGQAGSSITFDAGTLDTTLYILKLTHQTSGSRLNIRPTVSLFGGFQAQEGTTDDDTDNLTFDDGRQRKLATLKFDLDKFLTNARVSRTN